MKILQINISEFGCIKDKIIEPSGALNIIYGENESGKSTLLLFIKFMLYGLTRRSATNTERERSVSWSGHRAAGSMTVSHGGRNYRIERSFSESGRGGSEKLSLLCLDDGERIDIDKSVGEYFLGVPREVFEGTACVGQMRSAEINGDKLACGIENMLSAADESVDTAKILKTLDNIRVGYRHKNKTGGSLYDGEQKMLALRQRIEKAKESAQRLGEIERRLRADRSAYAVAKADFEQKDALLGELNKVSTLKRFEALRAKESEKIAAEAALCEKQEKMKKGDFLPDRNHTAELKIAARGYAEAEKVYLAKREQMNREDGKSFDEGLAALGEKLEAAGGKAAVIFEADSKKKRAASAKTRGVILLVAAIAVSAAGSALAALGIFLGLTALVALPVGVIAAIISFASAGRLSREAEKVAAEYGTTPEGLAEKLELCASELISCRQYREVYARAEAELSLAENTFAEKKRELYAILSKTADVKNADIESAAAEFKRIESFIAERERALSEIETLSRMISVEKESLSHYDEEALRSEISLDISEITPKMIAEAERERQFLSSKTRSLFEAISKLEREEINYRANEEDPLPLADELAELEKKHGADSQFYDALTLAMESIESASGTLRGNVTPVISQKAGEILERLSDGKYSVLRTNNALALSLDKDGYGIKAESLSAGTKDAAYLALRLSLFMRIFGADLPPLILDESLCQLDEKRASRMLGLLGGLGKEGVQTLLFTSHKREEQLCETIGVEYNAISL